MSGYGRAAKCYWLALVAAGCAALLWALLRSLALSPSDWAQFVVLLSLALLSGARPIPIPNTSSNVTAADAFVFLGVIFLGTPAGVLLAAAGSLTSTLRTSRRATSRLASPAVAAIAACASGQCFYWALQSATGLRLDRVALDARLGLDELLAPLTALALAQYAANGALVAAFAAFKERRSPWRCWREGYLWTSWTFFAAGLAAGLVYEAVRNFGLPYVALAVPVLAASHATYKTYFERVDEKTREAAEAGRLHLATVEALAAAIDAKDQTTHFHVRRVQHYATRMGELMCLPPAEIEALRAGALLHDVGKLAVPDHILNKPGELTTAEFERMKVHTTVGAQILERVNFPYPVVPIVLHHHERWDGRGYPEGLRGEEIPVTARILAAVDCFDSLREDRPHRRGMTTDEAGALLARGAGAHFDPRVVSLFLKHLSQFEQEVVALGLDRHGFTTQECAPRALVGGGLSPDERDLPAGAPRSAGTTPAHLAQIEDAHREAFALYEIARAFGSSLDLSDTLSSLVGRVGQLVPFDACVVYLYDEQQSRATAAHVAGRGAESLRGRVVAPGEGVVGFVLANRQPARDLDPALDFRDAAARAGAPAYRSMVALPLVRDERLLGALAVYSRETRRYTDDHARVLEQVARLASDALANAVDHAEAAANALTDTLTGLPNARALQARFEQETARARRTRKGFQVVMLDLDSFKQVNDTFGHKVGDQLLREVARLLQSQLREYDFLARYAGDEFVALLQDCGPEQVVELSERIERVVTEFALRVGPDGYARVGISVGSAGYGAHGDTLDQLLVAADRAMYRVKSDHKHGRSAPAAPDADGHSLDTGKLASTAVN